MSRYQSLISGLVTLVIITSCNPATKDVAAEPEYDIAAYVWPSCHNGERNSKVLWPEGIGEWEIIQKGTPRFEGHYQPKVPLWGYEMDNEPKVVERWIDVALEHGVNVFIYDWYWYDGAPFLESALNDGFLKAKNNEKMKFYVMWANHDVKKNYWNHYKYDTDSLLWKGATDRNNFNIIVDRIIEQYFSKPNYYKIDGKPVFSIFHVNNFLSSFDNPEEAKEAVEHFRQQTREAGFPGLHLQFIAFGNPGPGITDNVEYLGANSMTMYNWGGPHHEDYIAWAKGGMERINKWDEALEIPFFPNASIGWDDTPRFPLKTAKDVVHYNNSPVSFATYLQRAKQFADDHPDQAKLITLFSWNEWVEGGYLLPDMKYGFEYLKAVKSVSSGEYDK